MDFHRKYVLCEAHMWPRSLHNVATIVTLHWADIFFKIFTSSAIHALVSGNSKLYVRMLHMHYQHNNRLIYTIYIYIYIYI